MAALATAALTTEATATRFTAARTFTRSPECIRARLEVDSITAAMSEAFPRAGTQALVEAASMEAVFMAEAEGTK
jgi:hypothetical protein